MSCYVFETWLMRNGDRILQKVIGPLAWHMKSGNKRPCAIQVRMQRPIPENFLWPRRAQIVYVCLHSYAQTYSASQTSHIILKYTNQKKTREEKKRQGWKKKHWFLEGRWDKVALCSTGCLWITELKLILLFQSLQGLGLEVSTNK